MSTKSKTTFAQAADAYQNSQFRTKQAGVKAGVENLVILIIGFIVCLILLQVFQMGWIWWFALMGAFGIPFHIARSLGYTIVNSLRPTKVVNCPKCGVGHRIYKSVRKYMCTNCRTLLLLGKNTQAQPQFSNCPHCGLQTALTNDFGSFICPNCGLVRQLAGTSVQSQTRSCPRCQQSVPEEAIYCKTCGNILRSNLPTPPPTVDPQAWRDHPFGFAVDKLLSRKEEGPLLFYDLDWKIGKDAEGHFYFSRVLLTSIREEVDKIRNMTQVGELLTKLWGALLSVEEALQEPKLRASVETLVPEIDIAYAMLLECELRQIQALRPSQEFEKYALNTIATEPHITMRRKVESILGDSLTSSGSIGSWGDKLVDIEQDEKHSRVRGYKKLENEVARFTVWRGQQES